MVTRHDRKVRKIAKNYKKRGFSVLADVPGFKRPKVVSRRRADVVALKGRSKVLVEVETKKSNKTDQAQQRDLKKIAKNKGYRYRKVQS